MKVINQNGKITFRNITNISDKLPLGNYLLGQDMEGFFLAQQPDFSFPKKLYGDFSITERWNRSFQLNSDKNLGILLSGIKGAGKTILAKKFCADSKRPTIMINAPFKDLDFVAFLAHPMLRNSNVFIDEFEKIYHDFDHQKHFLSIMDGIFESRLVFLLTTNSSNLNSIFFNRLNRIKYHLEFTDLDKKCVDEIINDLLINKTEGPGLIRLMNKINIRSYDVLVSIIKEMNTFNESAESVAYHLNLSKESTRYMVDEIWNGKKHFCGTMDVGDRTSGKLNFYRPVADYTPKVKVTKTGNEHIANINLAECELADVEEGFQITTPKGLVFLFKRLTTKSYSDDY